MIAAFLFVHQVFFPVIFFLLLLFLLILPPPPPKLALHTLLRYSERITIIPAAGSLRETNVEETVGISDLLPLYISLVFSKVKAHVVEREYVICHI